MCLLTLYHVPRYWRLNLADILQTKPAVCFMRKWAGPVVFFPSAFSLVTLNAHISPSHRPLRRSWLCLPLFEVAEECSAQQLSTGEQNVFGACPLLYRTVIIVSCCHLDGWRGPFLVSVTPTGEGDGLKRSSLEGGKGHCGGQSKCAESSPAPATPEH